MRQLSSIVAIIASAGRPDVVGDVILDLLSQTRQFDAVILSVPDSTSLPSPLPSEIVVVMGSRGSAAQRNAGLAAAPTADFAFFFDDDSRVRSDYAEATVRAFEADGLIIGTSGRAIIDGALGAVAREISSRDAITALKSSESEPRTGKVAPRTTLHGCNFAVRIGRTSERFDERLPLYSWLEDHDLARRLMRQGKLVTVHDAVIVHRGVSSGGRQSHLRFGYSQVMNPAYFLKKGTFGVSLALKEIARPVARNVLQSVAGRSRSWRRIRLRGNLLAVADVCRRRFTPERILDL